MREIKYDYTECEEGISQYEDIDFELGEKVNARYIKAPLAVDSGNPYIEALPMYRSKEMIEQAYSRILRGYEYDQVKNMSETQKLLQLQQLRSVRFPMPFDAQLERDFYLLLVSSYRARKPFLMKTDSLKYYAEDAAQESPRRLIGDQSEATSAGFSLTGYSGCGKSSAIHMLVSNYPQYINHGNLKDGYFPQIPYLVVNCVAGSNFNALYSNIGEALDLALGNSSGIYAAEIERIKGLGQKAAYICKLIEAFAIGVIIFDEIQLLDFGNGSERSFDSLLTITNKTKVGIVAVGTEQAREKFAKNLHIARRVGRRINANAYCENYDFFDMRVGELLVYQWFDEYLEQTEEITEALYCVTKGIIDQLVSVYMGICLDQITKSKKRKIDAAYIKEIAEKLYPGCQDILKGIKGADLEKWVAENRGKVDALIADALNSDKHQKEEAERLKQRQQAMAKANHQVNDIIKAIQALIGDEYSGEQIEKAYRKVMQRKGSADKTPQEINVETLKLLTAEPKKKSKPDGSSMTTEAMMSYLEVDKKE